MPLLTELEFVSEWHSTKRSPLTGLDARQPDADAMAENAVKILLGEQLMGKKSGDQPQLTFGGTKQPAKILSVE